MFSPLNRRITSGILANMSLATKNYAVATVDRAENTDSPQQLHAVINYLKSCAALLPLSPRTDQAARRLGIDLDGLTVIASVAASI